MRDAVFVGIDVSKGTLDVALLPSGESFRVGNDQGGISALVERLSGVQPELVVLEASGGYETAVVAELAAASIAVTVVNPRQVRDFARAIGQLEKSDVLGARILALFPERVRPEVRPLADERTAICRRWWRAAVSWWRCWWQKRTSFAVTSSSCARNYARSTRSWTNSCAQCPCGTRKMSCSRVCRELGVCCPAPCSLTCPSWVCSAAARSPSWQG
jgi:hypothetical protein